MRQVYGAKELSDILGVSESKSYEYIRIMNSELKRKRLPDSAGQGSGGLCTGKIFRSESR